MKTIISVLVLVSILHMLEGNPVGKVTNDDMSLPQNFNHKFREKRSVDYDLDIDQKTLESLAELEPSLCLILFDCSPKILSKISPKKPNRYS